MTTMYHPLATAIDSKGEEQKLITYDGLSSIEECLKQFDWWQNEYGYKIKTACVQIIKDDGTVENRYYESRWVEVGKWTKKKL